MKKKLLLGILGFALTYVLVGALLDNLIFPEAELGPDYYPRPGQVFVSESEGFRQTVLKREGGLVWLELVLEHDGSLTIISTPGHTPGHQSLLVKLPKTGALLLTGDVVHFQYMWDQKIVPSFNFNKEQSLASIERVERLVAEHKAQIWIGHDKDITAKINRFPKFYE